MESSRPQRVKLPDGYVGQHTLWTRATFRSQQYSMEWHLHPGMILFLPRKDENDLHVQFARMDEYRKYQSGLPLPSRELAGLALRYLNGTSEQIGRKRRFERTATYVRDIANSVNGKHQAAEARLYANHMTTQLDFYDNVLTAHEERELGLI